MFEISWSELLILGVVTLIFVGPKELPALFRTLGKYVGAIKRHASEFRVQFDDAMREVELESMRKEVESMQTSINDEVMRAKSSLDGAANFSTEPSTPAAPQSALQAAPEASVSEADAMPPMPAPPSQRT